MAPSKQRTECVGEEKVKEPTCHGGGNVKKFDVHCEDVTAADKENQGNTDTQVVLVLYRVLVCKCLVSPTYEDNEFPSPTSFLPRWF